ncbi:MAG: MFS transporter [Verrucomicrobium sp.]|nr:MFS transporter [Verrucomicrobium sp.]
MGRFWQVLRQPDFFRLWFGQIISSIGDRFYQCALLTVVLGLNQGTQIGKESARVIFVGMLPGLLFAPLIGWVIDHCNRRRVLIFADLSRVLLVSVLIAIWFLLHNLGWVYVIVFFIGGMNSLFIPARQAALPQLVPPADLIPANALIAMVGVIASLVGTFCGGLVASIFGARASFFITAFGFAASAYFILRIAADLKPAPRTEKHGTWKQIAAGWQYVRENPPTQWIIVLNTLFAFVTGFFMISVLEFAVGHLDLSVLHHGVAAFGRFLSRVAPRPPVINMPLIAIGLMLGAMGAGLGLGSLTCGSSRRWTRSAALPFVSFVGLGLLLAGFGHLHGYMKALLVCVILGWSSALFVIPIEARLQAEVPNACRGRLFALRNFCTSVAFLVALALHLNGELLRILGPSLLITCLGGGMAAFGLGAAWLNRRNLQALWHPLQEAA